ncbi:MAG: VOC family protein [Pseudomonadota bacterium]
MTAAPFVFFDIAGPDSGALSRFYSDVFGWSIDDAGQVSVSVQSPLDVAFRQDPAEHRMYIGVADVTQTLNAIEAAGGSIDAPRLEVPGVVVLGLFRDPAGNPMGLVEMDGDKPVVPG